MIENCGECRHLFCKSVMGLPIYGCEHPSWAVKKRPVVPHVSKRDFANGARNATFHRVPEWCPLPDSEAHKRPEDPEFSGGER